MSLTSRPSASPRGPHHRGRIKRVRGDGRVDVEVKRLNETKVFDRCDVIEGPWTPVTLTTVSGHTHVQTSPAPLAAGDRVFVAFVEGRPDDLIVIGRIRP